MTEQWRAFGDGRYAVSNLGNVRREVPGKNTKPGKLLAQRTTNWAGARGYPTVSLKDGNKSITKFVHCLVAEAFLGARPAGHEVDHKNGNKRDPRAENLEYVTPAENVRRAVATGLRDGQARGETHPNAKLTAEEVREIRVLFSWDMSVADLAEQFGVSDSTIRLIASGQAWRSVA